jgi:hypothetical protein
MTVEYEFAVSSIRPFSSQENNILANHIALLVINYVQNLTDELQRLCSSIIPVTFELPAIEALFFNLAENIAGQFSALLQQLLALSVDYFLLPIQQFLSYVETHTLSFIGGLYDIFSDRRTYEKLCIFLESVQHEGDQLMSDMSSSIHDSLPPIPSRLGYDRGPQ